MNKAEAVSFLQTITRPTLTTEQARGIADRLRKYGGEHKPRQNATGKRRNRGRARGAKNAEY